MLIDSNEHSNEQGINGTVLGLDEFSLCRQLDPADVGKEKHAKAAQ